MSCLYKADGLYGVLIHEKLLRMSANETLHLPVSFHCEKWRGNNCCKFMVLMKMVPLQTYQYAPCQYHRAHVSHIDAFLQKKCVLAVWSPSGGNEPLHYVVPVTSWTKLLRGQIMWLSSKVGAVKVTDGYGLGLTIGLYWWVDEVTKLWDKVTAMWISMGNKFGPTIGVKLFMHWDQLYEMGLVQSFVHWPLFSWGTDLCILEAALLVEFEELGIVMTLASIGQLIVGWLPNAEWKRDLQNKQKKLFP